MIKQLWSVCNNEPLLKLNIFLISFWSVCNHEALLNLNIFLTASVTTLSKRSSVDGASCRGARPPGLEPGRAQKKSPLPEVPELGSFFATGNRCRFLLMKYGGDRHISDCIFMIK